MATRELTELEDPINIDSISRLRFSKIFEEDVQVGNPTTSKWGSIRFWGMWSRPDIPTSVFDKYHQVTSKDQYRLDAISYKYYGTPDLAWVIASANEAVLDPIQDIIAGRFLRIPATVTIFSEVII
jgi:hypothetical protein